MNFRGGSFDYLFTPLQGLLKMTTRVFPTSVHSDDGCFSFPDDSPQI